jgi:hypothetical protein
MTNQAYEEITVNDTAAPISAALLDHPSYGPAQECQLAPEGDGLRVTYHGVNPSNTVASEVGLRIAQNQMLTINRHADIENFRMINLTPAGTAIVRITYWYY